VSYFCVARQENRQERQDHQGNLTIGVLGGLAVSCFAVKTEQHDFRTVLGRAMQTLLGVAMVPELDRNLSGAIMPIEETGFSVSSYG
jgi:hypothetical protein